MNSSDLLPRFRKALAEIGVDVAASPVIVALSGGADSVALLELLRRAGAACIAAHCNFHLRGDESLRDERHACSVAQRLGAEVVVEHFDVEAYRKRCGVSVEMACRELRYAWFERLREERGACAIAVGHHRDDNIETFFLKLLRRAGIDGLAAMRPVAGRIIRPMLSFSRSEIESYLASRGLTFVTDSTNRENIYQRNRLRNKVLPMLESEFPGAIDAITASIAHLSEVREFVDGEISGYRAQFVGTDGAIDLRSLLAALPHSTARFVLFRLLRDADIATVDSIIASADSSGLWFEGKWLLDRGRLVPATTVDNSAITGPLSLLPFQVTEHPIEDFPNVPKGTGTLLLDARVLDDGDEFTLRPWREGDRIAPFGMKGTRKLSDIFSDLHLSLIDKQRVRVLEHRGRILWVVGIRASRHYPIGPTTTRFLEIQLNKQPG